MIYRFNPNQPIPNDPFYYPQGEGLQSASGPLIVGSGLTVDYATGTISAQGGGGGGPVLVTSPITNSGTQTAPNIGIQFATAGQLGAVQVGTNISALNGVISVANSSLTAPGVVQLNNTVTSTSTTQALTANQGLLLQQQINALAVTSNLTIAGTFDASAAVLVTVSTDGADAGFTVGDNLPAPNPSIADYFVIISAPGIYTPPGGSTPIDAKRGDWFFCDGTIWKYIDVGNNLPVASETEPGVIELATLTEVDLGLDTIKAVTPATLSGTYLKKSFLATKGDLISAEAAGVPIAVPVGADNSVLTACASCVSGLAWTPLPAPSIPCACITALGSLLSGSAPGIPLAVALGTNGQLLSVNTACPAGLEWVTCVNTAIPCSCITGKGSILTGTGPSAPTALPPGLDSQVLVACSACASGLTWIASPANSIPCACITSKGSLVTGTGPGSPVPLGPGADNTVLTACAACPLGIAWTTANTNAIPCTCITAKGAILTGSAPNTPTALSVGVNGTVLVADSTCPVGMKWVSANTAYGDTPVGAVQWFSAFNVPYGWLVADGSTVSTVGYAALFDVIGTTYNPSVGSGFFTLPDLRGQWIRGWDSAGGNARGCDPGRVFGSSQQDTLGSHCHIVCLASGSSSPTWNNPVPGSPSLLVTAATAVTSPGNTRAGYTEPFGTTQNTVDNVALLPCIKWLPTLAPVSPTSGIPVGCVTGRGALITGTGPSTVVALPLGNVNGYVLKVNTACPTGLQWGTALSPGVNGQILVSCSACPEGTVWTTAPTTYTQFLCNRTGSNTNSQTITQLLPTGTYLTPGLTYIINVQGNYYGQTETTGSMRICATNDGLNFALISTVQFSSGTGGTDTNATIPFSMNAYYAVPFTNTTTYPNWYISACNDTANWEMHSTIINLTPVYS